MILQVFRIEPGRERCRTNKISEHHREQAPLGFVPARRCRRYSNLIELCNRAQHFLAMPERDSDSFEVLVGQIAENGRINIVVGKTLRVLPEAKSAETIRNLLHGGHRLSQVWPKGTLDKIDTISRPFLDGTPCARSLDFNPTRGYRYTTAIDSIVDREQRRRDPLTYEGAVVHWKCPNLA
jgi:hypothetical protein